MKTKIISLLFIFYVSICITSPKAIAQVGPVSFQIFYDDLSPYGTWINSPDYGYVWLPNVDAGFTPYATNGYWVFTDEGWTWVSNYSWGWAPFHYGRWYTDAAYGPMWVPDNEWGPGWVSWRRSDDYYGWAPIGPGISISVAYGNSYNVPNNQWTFVRGGDFGRRDINNRYVNSSNNVTIINNTTVINNTRLDKTRNVTYHGGPDRTEVEKHTGKTIAPVVIKESTKPGQSLTNNQLQVYRPQMQKNNSNGTKPTPTKIADIKDVKTSAQRTSVSPVNKSTQPNKQKQQQTKQIVHAEKTETVKQVQSTKTPTKSVGKEQVQQTVQPQKKKPSQPQPIIKPTEQKHSHPQLTPESLHQQPLQPQQTATPKNNEEEKQAQHAIQPPKQEPAQQQHIVQPIKQEQPQHNTEPPREQPSQPQKAEQPQNNRGERRPN